MLPVSFFRLISSNEALGKSKGTHKMHCIVYYLNASWNGVSTIHSISWCVWGKVLSRFKYIFKYCHKRKKELGLGLFLFMMEILSYLIK